MYIFYLMLYRIDGSEYVMGFSMASSSSREASHTGLMACA